ncbi:MAG TPA: 16S rRNA (guanine(966)-N(2))-methyltransferase RsmD [Bacteroidota bacterium]|nr:16S rRNA (guanine(966)-N(2))-methyltransferase RsmD [Bacteroidota bacterium]
MRIIAGQYRGRNLSSVRDLSIRPTTDRAKQTIFDILSNRLDFENIEVLDLFAGSGSLGLEAISRGAAKVTFVDRAQQSLDVLEKNIETLGCSEQCTTYLADVFWFLKNTRKQFDLLFVDPPYRLDRIAELPDAIHESPVVRPGTFVVMEHSKESRVEISELKFDVTRKPFGQTTVLIMQVRQHTA